MAISAYFVMVSLRLFSVHNLVCSGALTIVIFLYAFMYHPFNLNYYFFNFIFLNIMLLNVLFVWGFIFVFLSARFVVNNSRINYLVKEGWQQILDVFLSYHITLCHASCHKNTRRNTDVCQYKACVWTLTVSMYT